MADDLLVHYNRELLHIRRSAAAFAADHPKIAGRLRISEDSVDDPHVGRLIESFAYLTARIRQKLDDDFPELLDSLLGILYPHYQRPIPSMSIMQVEPMPDLASAYTLPAGAAVDTEAVDGEACRFRTAYPVTLHPVALRSAAIGPRPFAAPSIPAAANATSCLRLTFEASVPDAPMAEVAPDRLRLFLRGQPQLVYPLHELLLNDAVAVAFATGPGDPAPVVLDGSALQPVGFGLDEGLLPYPANAHAGFRLLTEYFAFPEKFLFVDLAFPARERLDPKRKNLDVFVYFRRTVNQLERAVGRETFALGCTPIVNLFSQPAEPIRVDQTRSEYRVVPDSRRQHALEVYSIDRVVSSDSGQNRQEMFPYYAIQHAGEATTVRDDEPSAWWMGMRRTGPEGNRGSETFLSFVNLQFDANSPPDGILSVDTTCLNRDLPGRLPFGGGHPQLKLVQPSPVVQAMRCLTAPTETLRTLFGQGGRWRLISHLSLNHLSLIDGGDANAIREILTLYDLKDSADTRALIDGIVGLTAKPGTARIREHGQTAFCRGVDIAMTFEEANFSGNSIFMMASVLERFFGLYVSVNAFARLTATVKGRSGVLRTWPARAGDRILL